MLRDRDSQAGELARLENELDGAALRWSGRLLLEWRSRRAGRRRAAGEARFELERVVSAEAVETRELARALSYALQQGALQSAAGLAARLRRQAPLGEGLDAKGLAACLSAALMIGEVDFARSLAQVHAGALAATADGTTLLSLVGLDGGAAWLPGRRPNFVGLSRRILEGSLDAEQLAGLLGARLRPWIAEPELNLLFFNALRVRDEAGAYRFLSRFLRAHGLPGCHKLRAGTAAPASVLDVAFESAARVSDGPLVSVAVAAHDAAETVCLAIDSLLGQTYQRLEILVGDDASTDETVSVLKQRYAAEPRVRLFASQANQGAYNLRNALFARARGELMTCHDADDLALPTRIAQQVERLAKTDSVACVGNWLRLSPSRGALFFADQRACRLSLVTLMLTRRSHEALGPFRAARIGADLERYADLRARYGSAAIQRLRAPLLLALWAEGSATRAPGAEALEDGYRSPARRAYSEWVFAKHRGASSAPSPLSEVLDANGNVAQPADLVELR